MTSSPGKGKAGDSKAVPKIQSRDLPRNWVPRPRLDELLDQASTRPLTLLVAPAGSGKSVVLRGWVARVAGSGRPVRWVSGRSQPGLDDGLSLQQALAEVGPRPAIESTAATGHARSRVRAVDRPDGQVLVVDDAHLLSSAELGLIVRTLEARSHALHLILATRRDLALPLVSLKLSDSLTEIRADQLLFTDDEADALIAAHAPGSSEMDVITVRERGRGWAAALVLGARAVSGASDRRAARYALAVTEQPVLDYLLGEVFDTLDARTSHVLLCTCATDTVAAADAVTMSADPDAVALLSRLAAEGMLVVASSALPSGEPTSFSYHPLLVELLRRRVMVGAEDHPLYAAAQVRTVRHHLMHGDPAAALQYAPRLDDKRWLVRLLCEHGIGLMAGGHRQLIARALDAVPDQLERELPAITALRALERRLAHDPAAAVRLATEAIRAADSVQMTADPTEPTDPRAPWTAEQFDRTLAKAALILRCWLARIGGGQHAEAVQRARTWLGCEDQVGERHRHVRPRRDLDATNAARGWLLNDVTVCEIWLGDLESARVHTEAALGLARAVENDAALAVGLAHLSVIEWASGNLAAADVHAQEAILIAESVGAGRDAFSTRARVVVAWVAMQRLDFARMEAELAPARAFLERQHDPFVQVVEHLIRGYLLVHEGEIAKTQSHLEAFPATSEPMPDFISAHLTTLRSWCTMSAGDADQIDQEIQQLEALDLEREADIARAVALDLRGRTRDALAVLTRVSATNHPMAANPNSAIAASAYLAWMLARDGQRIDAQAQVRDLLVTMTPHQRLFVSGVATKPQMVDLLTDEATSDALLPAAAEELEALLDPPRWLPTQAGPTPLESPPTPRESIIDLRAPQAVRARAQATPAPVGGPLVVDLTARERDVLRELALGGSYADIAQVLYITENTVKTHLASLYRKLGATRRADALRSARLAGLLDS